MANSSKHSIAQRLGRNSSIDLQLIPNSFRLFTSRRGRTQSVETLQSCVSSNDAMQLVKEEQVLESNEHIPTKFDDGVYLSRWLESDCPIDCLPKILAFCGPQQIAALSRTNRHWNKIARSESTWRVLCEELYKWKTGDKEPHSWFDLYQTSPCVPIDYSSIPKALEIAQSSPSTYDRRSHENSHSQQVRSIRVLLRPGKYILKQAVQIQALQGVTVVFETMEMPKNVYHNPHADRAAPVAIEQTPPIDTLHSVEFSPSKPTLRRLFSCNRQEARDNESITDYLTDFDEWLHGNNRVEKQRAILILRSRRHNEPVFRVSQGVLRLINLDIQHYSHGLDIWNGNAAVQVQPALSHGEGPSASTNATRPLAIMEQVIVSSRSGRGIVNIDGGKVVIRRCAVTDCAATGIYVGGPGSSAYIEQTDVIRNGVGNQRPRRGVSRGHSGIYLEQGLLCVRDCNVSNNTLTGISVVSAENAMINVEDSILVSNGTLPLELPPAGTSTRQRSVTKNNVMATVGEADVKSGLLL